MKRKHRFYPSSFFLILLTGTFSADNVNVDEAFIIDQSLKFDFLTQCKLNACCWRQRFACCLQTALIRV